MKKIVFVLIIIASLVPKIAATQTLGETAVKEILVKKFNERLPGILGNGKILDGLNLATLKIRPGYIKIKGQTKWNLKLGKHDQPVRFKGIISTRFKSFGKPDLLVNFPGDNFLFFRKYQRLSDLVNLKQILKKKEVTPSNKS